MKKGLFSLAISVFVIDQVIKWFVQAYIPLMPHPGINMFHNVLGIDFSIVHITNRGGAWGMLSNMHIPLLIVRFFLIGLLSYYVFKRKERRLPFLLILTGALSNVLDSFTYGHVVDMFYFVLWGYSYPVFNIADISICVGIGLLLLSSFHKKKACDAS